MEEGLCISFCERACVRQSVRSAGIVFGFEESCMTSHTCHDGDRP